MDHGTSKGLQKAKHQKKDPPAGLIQFPPVVVLPFRLQAALCVTWFLCMSTWFAGSSGGKNSGEGPEERWSRHQGEECAWLCIESPSSLSDDVELY